MCRNGCGSCADAVPTFSPTLSLGTAPAMTAEPAIARVDVVTAFRCPWWWLAIAFAAGYFIGRD